MFSWAAEVCLVYCVIPRYPDTNPGLSQLINSTYYITQSKCDSRDDIIVISVLELMLAPYALSIPPQKTPMKNLKMICHLLSLSPL